VELWVKNLAIEVLIIRDNRFSDVIVAPDRVAVISKPSAKRCIKISGNKSQLWPVGVSLRGDVCVVGWA